MVEESLSKDEWDELQALKDAISHNPASVAPHKMEQFTDLLVKTLYGKGDGTMLNSPTNY